VTIDAEAAADFIRERGDNIEQERLNHLLYDLPADGAALTAVLAGQRPDGGWEPFWAPNYSSLDATCFRLAQAEQLGVTGGEAIDAALAFLLSRQQPDGSWEEAEAVAESAPPWAQPGDLAARLYLTANCGYWVAMLGEMAPARQAARYLTLHLENGRLPSFLHAHWLAAGLLFLLGEREPAGAVLTYLATRIGELPASNLAWLLVTLLAVGVPPDELLLDQAMERLAALQRPDGGWQNEDGSQQEVHTALEALRAWRRIGPTADDMA
jgi:hypothetical protein